MQNVGDGLFYSFLDVRFETTSGLPSANLHDCLFYVQLMGNCLLLVA